MPAKSKAQFRFMKAVESGSIKKPGLSKEKAKEFTSENKSLKKLPEKAKVPPEKKKGYHGHEGSSHEHLAKQDRRGANLAAATKTVKIQTNYERCRSDEHEEHQGPERFAPREAPERAIRRSHDDNDPNMKRKK